MRIIGRFIFAFAKEDYSKHAVVFTNKKIEQLCVLLDLTSHLVSNGSLLVQPDKQVNPDYRLIVYELRHPSPSEFLFSAVHSVADYIWTKHPVQSLDVYFEKFPYKCGFKEL